MSVPSNHQTFIFPRALFINIFEYYNIKFDEDNITSGSFVSLQWNELGVRISTEELDWNSWGYMPNGVPRLIDTASPVDDKAMQSLVLLETMAMF